MRGITHTHGHSAAARGSFGKLDRGFAVTARARARELVCCRHGVEHSRKFSGGAAVRGCCLEVAEIVYASRHWDRLGEWKSEREREWRIDAVRATRASVEIMDWSKVVSARLRGPLLGVFWSLNVFVMCGCGGFLYWCAVIYNSPHTSFYFIQNVIQLNM